MAGKILIVDDDPTNIDIVVQELTDRGYAIETATDGWGALKKAEASRPDLILLDYMMPHMNGLEVLRELRKRGDDTPVVMITAYGTVERAVEVIKEGAYDFVTRPFKLVHVLFVVKKALEQVRLRREVEILSEEVAQRYRLIVGESPKMNACADLAKKAAGSKSTVLLLGESGTGKEIFARAIHNWSERKDKPFVTVNCVGLSKELLESELFGHEPGAFTGANQLKRGKMELAHGGTVFFDEVGDISSELQAKLLRFLQEREFERVGGTKPISVDIRIIAATNSNLGASVTNGHFREDLFHRLNVIPIILPPLRERKEDIPALSQFFLQKYATETRKIISEISPVAQEKLASYDWPGNVRELANAIERAVVLGSGSEIGTKDLSNNVVDTESRVASDTPTYRDGINMARKELIQRTLSKVQGNRIAAAKLLGIQEKYLFRLMRTFRIE